MKTLEDFYAAAALRFAPGGPGRVDWYMTDAEIVELLRLTAPAFRRTGALFIVSTPAGIVAIKPKEPIPVGNVDRGALFPLELSDGRHDRGWPKPPTGWRAQLAAMRRREPTLTG